MTLLKFNCIKAKIKVPLFLKLIREKQRDKTVEAAYNIRERCNSKIYPCLSALVRSILVATPVKRFSKNHKPSEFSQHRK